jgi:hypothetical protein
MLKLTGGGAGSPTCIVRSNDTFGPGTTLSFRANCPDTALSGHALGFVGPTDTIAFAQTWDRATYIYIQIYNGTVNTYFNTGIVANATQHNFEIEWLPNGFANFFIDGALVYRSLTAILDSDLKVQFGNVYDSGMIMNVDSVDVFPPATPWFEPFNGNTKLNVLDLMYWAEPTFPAQWAASGGLLTLTGLTGSGPRSSINYRVPLINPGMSIKFIAKFTSTAGSYYNIGFSGPTNSYSFLYRWESSGVLITQAGTTQIAIGSGYGTVERTYEIIYDLNGNITFWLDGVLVRSVSGVTERNMWVLGGLYCWNSGTSHVFNSIEINDPNNINIYVHDDIGIQEAPTGLTVGTATKWQGYNFESPKIREDVKVAISLPLSVFDRIKIEDLVQRQVFIPEKVNISESITVALTTPIEYVSRIESIFINEGWVELKVLNARETYQNQLINISESTTVIHYLEIQVHDDLNVAAEPLYVTYLIENYLSAPGYLTIYSAAPYSGQSFTNTNAGILGKGIGYFKRYTNPTGFIYAKLYAHTGTYGTTSGKPTGAALATSKGVNVQTISTSAFQEVSFDFEVAGRYLMSAATYYCLVFYYPGGDGGNYLQIGGGGTGAGGNRCGSSNGTTWTGYTDDLYFAVYNGVPQVEIISTQFLKYETINITEDADVTISASPILPLSVHDDINISESITRTGQLGGINVHDDINISESITRTGQLGSINLYDSIDTSEDVIVTNSQLGGINKDDSVNISESVTISNPDLGGINIYDSIDISESITETLDVNISLYDSVNISESVTISNPNLGGINLYDSVNISESKTITESQLGDINLYDSINISESVTLTNAQLGGINVYDSINVSESINVEEPLSVSIFDSINISESENSEEPLAVSVVDTINISESKTLSSTQLGGINLYDTLNISDVPNDTGQLGDIIKNVVIYDSFTTVSGAWYGGLYANHAWAQGTKSTTSMILDSVDVLLAKFNAPSGPIYVEIYASTGTYGVDAVPTGSALATSDSVEASTLPPYSGSGAYFNFPFSGSNRISLSENTDYFLVFDFPGGGASNNPVVSANTPENFTNGNSASQSGGVWTALQNYNTVFIAHGHPILNDVVNISESVTIENPFLYANTYDTVNISESYQVNPLIVISYDVINISESVTNTGQLGDIGNLNYIDSYDYTHANSTFYGFQFFGQSFLCKANRTLDFSGFYLNGNGATGTVVSKIYTMTGTFGYDSIPDTLLATSDSIDISTIPASNGIIYFNFSGINKIALTASQYYVITIESTPTSGTLLIYSDLGSPTHPGNASVKLGGNWVGLPGIGANDDLIFYVAEDRHPREDINISESVSVLPPINDLSIDVGDDINISENIVDEGFLYITSTTTLLDYYALNLTNSGIGYTDYAFGETFTISQTTRVRTTSRYLYRNGGRTGYLTARIYTDSGTYGVNSIPGTLLAVSDQIEANTLNWSFPGPYTTFTFSGANIISLAPGHYYMTVESTTGDYGFQTFAPIDQSTAVGDSAYYSGGTWTRDTPGFAFGIYGDDVLSDSINVSESVVVRSPLGDVNLYDSVNISESVTLTSAQLGGINIYDSINISEDLTDSILSYINLYDTINISESVTISNSQLGDINVFDTINISENFVDSGLFSLSVYDSINISESVTLTNTQLGGINVFDSINMSESISVSNSSLGNINVSDSVNISESVTVSNSNLGGINVSDLVDISESVIVSISQLGDINVFDSINFSESISLTGQLGDISVVDSINISENVTDTGVSNISVVDLVNISESVVVSNSQLGGINVYDSINISESVTLTNSQLGEINVYDSINISELTTVSNSQLGDINVSDSINISENFTDTGVLSTSVIDTINISESVVISNSQLGNINVSDTINISESIISSTTLGEINIIDIVNISESFIVTNTQLGTINVYDSINVSESTNSSINLGDINVSDSINISENFTDTGFSSISVFDTINISESVVISNSQLGDINVYDTVDISESVTISNSQLGNIDVSDTVNISETITISNSQLGDINLSDTVNISENFTDTGVLNTSVFDTINISESVIVLNSQLGNINIYDTINISENFTDTGVLNTSVFDTINISENVVDMGEENISVYDSINITESVTVSNSNLGGINVSDSVNISESVTVSNSNLGGINVSDSVNISESVTVSNSNLGGISVYDTIDISENVNLTGQLGDISVVDNINISENFTDAGILSTSVIDTVNISESVIVSNSQLGGINVSDEVDIVDFGTGGGSLIIIVDDVIHITEEVVLDNSKLGDISTTDSINISEDLVIRTQLGNIFATDSINISDNVALSNSQLGSINIIEIVNISEYLNINNSQLGDINIVDNVNISENITNTGELNVSVNDIINISENFQDTGEQEVSVFDLIDILESVTLENSQLGDINVSDDIGIVDYLESGIDKYDSIEISEEVTVENSQLGGIDIFDTINISENFQDTGEQEISVKDLVEISENIILGNSYLGGINVSDSVNVLDTDNQENPLLGGINVSDGINISENVILSNPQLGDINIYDSISISDIELVDLLLTGIQVAENIEISENVENNGQLGDINVFDEIEIDSDIRLGFYYDISVLDQINISESIVSESFRFSPSDSKPVAQGNKMQPVGRGTSVKLVGQGRDSKPVGKIAGFF